MKRYAIYQLPFENEKSRDLFFMKPKQIEAISDEFELVAFVDADDKEVCFRIANFVYEQDRELIEMVAPMHSMSTGDIVHDLVTDETFVCASFGFEKINMKEVA